MKRCSLVFFKVFISKVRKTRCTSVDKLYYTIKGVIQIPVLKSVMGVQIYLQLKCNFVGCYDVLGGGANVLGGGANVLGGGANVLGGGANVLGGGAISRMV